MKKMLIDTNIYSYAMKGDPEVTYVLKRVHEIAVSSITIGELLSGFKAGTRELENRKELAEFLDAPRVKIYGVDEDTADYYAEIINGLKTRGKPIPTNDIWIAAIAFQHGLRLFSKDRRFTTIAGLPLMP